MTMVFVLGVLLLSYMLAYRQYYYLLVCATVSGGVLYLARHSLLASKGIRLRMWAAYLDYWGAKESFWFGIGPGSFEIWGPTIGVANPVVPGAQNGAPVYSTSWVHNDWLQILWEYGFVGFGIFSVFYIYLLVRAFKKPHTFAGLMGYGTCMFFYSPLHFLVSQLILFIYVRKALAD